MPCTFKLVEHDLQDWEGNNSISKEVWKKKILRRKKQVIILIANFLTMDFRKVTRSKGHIHPLP